MMSTAVPNLSAVLYVVRSVEAAAVAPVFAVENSLTNTPSA